jgi:hypothetical protein
MATSARAASARATIARISDIALVPPAFSTYQIPRGGRKIHIQHATRKAHKRQPQTKQVPQEENTVKGKSFKEIDSSKKDACEEKP